MSIFHELLFEDVAKNGQWHIVEFVIEPESGCYFLPEINDDN